ncbi:DNA primase [Oligella urethralis]|uniref:DNA primase n=1 Tax=Oligella urethralis DNF00040 TaxID=1401065 RepID=A0A096AMI8_9BURK|nr:DNA primase [Oligella urethralis]KGF31852.1 DNA primase [Oligella urethralis DNF00040]
MIPEDFIQELLARVDIVDVVGKYVQLKKGGQNLQGLCPFHQEKTPSFTVSPTKQFYHCFGCGAHGTAIRFVMDHVGLSFPDAVRHLADSVGMVVPQPNYSPEARARFKARKTRYDLLHEALDKAQNFYHHQLSQYRPAQDYLMQRGLTPEVAQRFGLGWSGSERQNLRHVFEDYADELLIDAGIVIQNEQGLRYDRFRERITFPIYNQRGRIIGFGGRVIGKGQPKYLNSPETELFHKGSELYGLWENRQGIRKAATVLVVEGYMDVVSLARYGIDYAVATLGTATTADHINKLVKATNRIVFCFDGDAAGQRAAWRALTTSLPLLRDDIALRFLFLPKEHDPDSFVQAYGLKKFEEKVSEAQPLSAFLLETLAADYNLNEAEGRAACLNAAISLVDQIPTSTIRTQIEKELARLVRFTVDEFSVVLQRHQAGKNSTTSVHSMASSSASEPLPERVAPTAPLSDHATQTRKTSSYRATPTYQRARPKADAIRQPMPLARQLLSLLANHPSLLDKIGERQLEILRQHPHMEVVVEFISFAFRSGARHIGSLIQQAEHGSPLHQLLLSLGKDSSSIEALPNPEAEWNDALKKLELDILQAEINTLISSGMETESERRRYMAVLARFNFLKS